MILVVDDEVLIRDIICEELRLAGYTTCEAGSGDEALAIIRANPTVFRLIISDVVMPGGDGITLLASVKAQFPSVKVLLISGFAELTPEQARAKGAIGLVQKPFEFKDLWTLIHPILSENQAS